jgi:hypothetical protein
MLLSFNEESQTRMGSKNTQLIIRIDLQGVQAGAIALFFSYIMLVYPLLNTMGVQHGANRGVLVVLIALVLAINFRGFLLRLVTFTDFTNLLVLSYLLFVTVSLACYTALTPLSMESLLPFLLHGIFPILLYFCYDRHNRHLAFILKVIVIVTAINVVFGVLAYPLSGFKVPFLAPDWVAAIGDNGSSRLSSFLGKSSILGYMTQLAFAYVLFCYRGRLRPLCLFLFLFATVLTFQRGAWAGIGVSLSVYIFFTVFSKDSSGHRSACGTLVYLLFGCLAGIAIMSSFFDREVVFGLLGSRFFEFNVSSAMEGREFQHVIFNNTVPFNILFGEGYGKYSPLNLLDNFKQPDAPYHMVYNETGLVGFALFLSIFTYPLFLSIFRRNSFMVYFLLSLLISLSGSRILWYCPTNFIVFFIIAVLGDQSSLPFAARQERNKAHDVRPLHGNYPSFTL